MALTLNRLLQLDGYRPEDVSVIFHTTRLPMLRRMLPWLASERPDLFDAYQSVHSITAERTLCNRPYAASFVPGGAGDMILVGLYHIDEVETLPTCEIYGDPRFAELEQVYGATDTAPAANIARADRQMRFGMSMTEALRDLRGRMRIAPPGGRAYVRIAANLDAPVTQISETPQLTAAVPDWREFVVNGPELRGLPQNWAARLREWRGVYLITDETDGARYVGSAYGQDNLLGRWQAHVARDRGVTRDLARRDPVNFRFSILERVSPDMAADEVIALEHDWMNRLHTRRYGLNA